MSVKIGLSTYSLQQEIDSGRMTLPEVLTWKMCIRDSLKADSPQ